MAGAAAVCAVAALAGVVADAHVPRAHHLPRSTSRFEVPRAAPDAPRTMSTMGRDETAFAAAEQSRAIEVAADGETGDADLVLSLGGLTMDVTPYGGDPLVQARRKLDGRRIRIAGGMTVTGGMPADVIKRITRQQFGRFRIAYENGLRKNEQLAGRVVVRFVIGPDGSVLQSSDDGSSLPDAAVVETVVHALMLMSFPSPESGPVIVTLPIEFTP